MPSHNAPLIRIESLHIAFPLEEGVVDVVQDVSFAIPRATTVGLVGESGCGKSMTGLSMPRLVPTPGKVTRGRILYDRGDGAPVDIAALPLYGEEIRRVRGKEIAMIFQEPMSSLNPVYTIGSQIAEMILVHERMSGREARDRSIDMLKKVGIPAPELRVDEHPHQLSGGMRQRAMIAMALSCRPNLLIADEPTTALDVTVQAQILDLMQELQQEMGMAILLISHDLGVIADLAEEVVVMYAGKVVERGSAEAVFYDPQHPYTRGLLKAAPVLGNRTEGRLYSIPGVVPDPAAMPRGCAFRPRCAERLPQCLEPPMLLETTSGHFARCWAREGKTNG